MPESFAATPQGPRSRRAGPSLALGTCAGVVLWGAVLTWAQNPGAIPAAAPPKGTEGKAPEGQPAAPRAGFMLREGTEVVDQRGYFGWSNNRLVFSTVDGTERFVTLENLNLERVAKALADSQERLIWIVSGTITEFRGSRYLLVRRAVLKGA
jgi:hypothetical protein